MRRQRNDVACAQTLIAAGAPVVGISLTAAPTATMAEFLLSQGAYTQKEDALKNAIRSGNVLLVKLFLKQDIDLEKPIPKDLYHFSTLGNTPLKIAKSLRGCTKNHEEIYQLIENHIQEQREP